MTRKRKSNFFSNMKPAAVRRLTLAVFLVFGALGPVTVLMESELRPVSWSFIVLQTIAAGGMAASIVFVSYNWRRWWTILLTIVFWGVFMLHNGGGLNFVFDDQGFRMKLAGPQTPLANSGALQPRVLTAAEINAIYTQRGIVGILAVTLISLGYVTFLRVIGKEEENRTRLETEVKIAHDIQQSLLPQAVQQTSWCETAGLTLPATEVGGDYFDIVELPNGNVVVAIADVAGHGVGAGVLSAMAKSALRSQLEHDDSPANVVTNLNKVIFDLSSDKMFVTFAYLVADRHQGMIRYVTAGHPPILFISRQNNKVTELRTVNIGLGMKRDAQFVEGTIEFKPGDRVLLYTDGVIESANSAGDEFGTARLEELFLKTIAAPQGVGDAIVGSLRGFTKEQAFQDDVSLVCMKFV